MRQPKQWFRSLANFGLASGVAATVALAGSAAMADPITNYDLLTTIPIPATEANTQPGGAFTSFDISFFDPVTNADYVADRSNAAVDIISGSSLSVVAQPGGFTGQQATTSVSGPDGVVVADTGPTLFAGDGNSTLKSFNVSNPAAPTTAFPPLNTGGSFRVDEMAFSPKTNLVLAANNADNPAFATLVNASTGAAVVSHITVPGGVGLEQPAWNPKTGSFFVSVPSFGGTDPGGVAEIKTDGTVGNVFHFASFGIGSCSPTGLAVGAGGSMMVGCGNAGTQTIVLNPAGMGSIKTIPQISGSDELWYDPATKRFYVTGIDTTTGRAFDVIADGSFKVLQSVSLPDVNAHSIAVDFFNSNVFVPLEGSTATATDPLCTDGCVAVYAESTAVPEPSSIALMLTALVGLAGIAVRLRQRPLL